MRLQVIICHKKELLSSLSSIKLVLIRNISQQVLPVQTALYWYDEWIVQDINDKNLNESLQNLTEFTLVR